MASDSLRRLERETLGVLVALTFAAFLWRPDTPRLALGVVGGGVLIGLAYGAIRGLVDGLASGGNSHDFWNKSRGFVLVKFFTRHAILALVGYGMMTRLELHPMGLLIGVTAPAVAAALEAARQFQRSTFTVEKNSSKKKSG